MDLMRTLLIYMSATLTLAVQNTAAPKVTPTPSPVPAAVVETIGTPAPGEAQITAVPPDQLGSVTPTEKITPLPVPTITPNMKAYHNLTMGTKGKEVRKLQEKLIEMGYLPEGAADGAYGRQTYNAVKKFQYYNGLRADGIAGRSTQTNLFENPEAAPNPEVTAAPETAAPETAVPEATEVPEIKAPEVTEAPEAAEEPEASAEPEAAENPAAAEEAETTEEPAAEEPEVSAEPETTEEPEMTEAPAATEEPAPAGEPEATEAPEMTAEPAATERPGAAEEPEAEEIIENVDLDADLYEPVNAAIALNEGNGPLEFIETRDGVPVTARPRVTQSGSKIRVSLDDLCKCVEKWQLTDENTGSIVLEAAGYTLALYNEDRGCSATVDGREIPMKDDDYDFLTEGHFINAGFLATALKGDMEWDQEENTLMLRIRDKEAVESAD